MQSTRENARLALISKPIPIAPVAALADNWTRSRVRPPEAAELLREIDPEEKEFATRPTMASTWRVLTHPPDREGYATAMEKVGLPRGPWVFLRSGRVTREGPKLIRAVIRSVLLLGVSADVSARANTRWSGMVRQTTRLEERISELSRPTDETAHTTTHPPDPPR